MPGITVAAALREATVRLDTVGGTGRLDAALLLEFASGVGRAAMLADGDTELTADAYERFAAACARRARGVPVAYIVGSAGFFGRTFAVDERVLVPRPETEHVIEAVLADLRDRCATGGRIADVGTGSGAIAITLACELPGAWVFGTDVSRGALSVARRNAARNNVFQACTFLCGDLAAPLEPFGPFDALVANLPYVPTDEVPHAPDPASFEPRLALDGGADGLDAYRRLIGQLPGILARSASIFFEAAPGTVEPLAALVRSTFPDARIAVGRDYGGRERFVAAAGRFGAHAEGGG